MNNKENGKGNRREPPKWDRRNSIIFQYCSVLFFSIALFCIIIWYELFLSWLKFNKLLKIF